MNRDLARALLGVLASKNGGEIEIPIKELEDDYRVEVETRTETGTIVVRSRPRAYDESLEESRARGGAF